MGIEFTGGKIMIGDYYKVYITFDDEDEGKRVVYSGSFSKASGSESGGELDVYFKDAVLEASERIQPGDMSLKCTIGPGGIVLWNEPDRKVVIRASAGEGEEVIAAVELECIGSWTIR